MKEEKNERKKIALVVAAIVLVIAACLVVGHKIKDASETNNYGEIETTTTTTTTTKSAAPVVIVNPSEKEEFANSTTTSKKASATGITQSSKVISTTSPSTTKAVTNKLSNYKGKLENYTSIYIEKEPDKRTYYCGDEPSIKGLVVKGMYSNGKTKTIPDNQLDIIFPNTYTNGDKKVTIKYGTELSTSYTIKVKKPTIKILDDEIDLYKGDTYKLNVEVSPSNQKIEWISASEKIATVDKKGFIEAVDYGGTTIMAAFTYNGIKYYSDSCFVSVQYEEPEMYFADIDYDLEYDRNTGILYMDLYGSVSSNHPLQTAEICLEGFLESYDGYGVQSYPLNCYDEYSFDFNQFTYEFEADEGETYSLYILVTDSDDTCEYAYYIDEVYL